MHDAGWLRFLAAQIEDNGKLAKAVAGQPKPSVTPPLAWTASNRLGTFTSSAYQYQPSMFFCSGSKVRLPAMPCSAGATPVTRVV